MRWFPQNWPCIPLQAHVDFVQPAAYGHRINTVMRAQAMWAYKYGAVGHNWNGDPQNGRRNVGSESGVGGGHESDEERDNLSPMRKYC